MIGRKLRIEYHLQDKCNLNCKACSHFSNLVKEEETKPLDKIYQDFKKIHELTNKGDSDYMENITIMGGEPLMYPYVSESMTLIRSLFSDVPITLLTNGILLHKMDENFWESIARNDISIQISQYPINFDYENKIYKVLVERKVRWTTYTILEDDKRVFDGKWLKNKHNENYKEIHKDCRWRYNCTHLVDGKLHLCAMIAYFPIFDKTFKGHHSISLMESDHIDLDKINSWDELQIERDKVPHFCGHCRGLDHNMEEWGRTTGEIGEYLMD